MLDDLMDISGYRGLMDREILTGGQKDGTGDVSDCVLPVNESSGFH